MAEEKSGGGGFWSEMGMVVVGFVLLIILWFANDGPAKSDLRGVFLNPLPPVGRGSAYGPQYGTSTVPQYEYYQPQEDEYYQYEY